MQKHELSSQVLIRRLAAPCWPLGDDGGYTSLGQ